MKILDIIKKHSNTFKTFSFPAQGKFFLGNRKVYTFVESENFFLSCEINVTVKKDY